MTRMPVVADRFYPGNPARLRAAMDLLVPEAAGAKKRALAVVLPHAGYVYSGATAGRTVSEVQVPETVVLLGPNHHGRGAALAMGTEDWQMPMGTVPVDRQLAAAILERSTSIVADEEASMARATAEGGKVAQPEDRPAWEAGARKVWVSFAPKLGGIERIETIAKTA